MIKSLDEKTGISYILHGDYYLPDLELPESKDNRPIGKWGQLHLNHLKNHCKSTYYTYLMNGTLHYYLCSINDQAEEMFDSIVKQLKDVEGVTEQLKEDNQMEWVLRMGNIQQRAREVIYNELIYHLTIPA